MFTVLLVIHVIITLAMIIIILMQRSTGGLGGMGGGNSGGGLVSSRGQANLLTRTTAILATLFIVNSLALSWLTQQDAPSRSIAEEIEAQKRAMTPSVPTPEAEETESSLPAADMEADVKPDEEATPVEENGTEDSTTSEVTVPTPENASEPKPAVPAAE